MSFHNNNEEDLKFEDKPHACDKCFGIFDTEKSLEKHKINEHSESLFTSHVSELISSGDEKLNQCNLTVYETKVKNEDMREGYSQGHFYKCDMCDESFIQKIDLELHMFNMEHHKDNGNNRPSNIKVKDEPGSGEHNKDKRKDSKVKKRPRTASKRHCEICDKIFSTNRCLKKHMLLHTGEKPYKCAECDKAFAQSGHLTCHMLTHTGAKPYSCAICGRSFSTSSAVRRHHSIHSDDRPYQCSKCDKSFKRREGLRGHMFSHKETKFDCSQCGKQFKSPLAIKRHSIVHTNTHKCTKCDKSFARKARLERHKVVHVKAEKAKDTKRILSKKKYIQKLKNGKVQCRKIQCNKCGQMFWKKINLKTHLWNCFEKPQKCEQCCRSFFLEKTLKFHQKVHTPE